MCGRTVCVNLRVSLPSQGPLPSEESVSYWIPFLPGESRAEGKRKPKLPS